MNVASHIEARPPNWLPLPGEERREIEEMPVVGEDDLFPKGEVTAFYPQQGSGSIRDGRGKEFPFRLAEIDLIGPKGNPRYIAAGGRVGYDVSWTSGGLRISKLKIY